MNNKIINLYDESIFSTPLPQSSILNYFSLFRVYNKVDEWLLREKHNKGPQIIGDSSMTATTTVPEDKILNINPETPRPGVNLFTIDSTNADKVVDLQTYIQIQVYDNDNDYIKRPTQKLEIIDFFRYDKNKILTVDRLTSLESALLVKFYAIRYKEVIVDRLLYSFICNQFVDNRAWFRPVQQQQQQQEQQQQLQKPENIHFNTTNRVFGLY